MPTSPGPDRSEGEAASFATLFSTARIGGIELGNRVVKAAQATSLANADGTVSSRNVAHYEALATGGTGLVVVEFTYVDDDASRSMACQLGASREDHVSGLSWLVDTIHASGAKAALQIGHCGRQKALGRPPIKAPSAIPWPSLYERTGLVPSVLSLDEIEAIVQAFGDAARRAWQAGFDFVEVHGAHGYLVTEFLSAHTNSRADRYGGSLSNRMRFLLEIVEDIQRKVPQDLPTLVRLSASDHEPGGITVEETIAVATELERAGVAALDISGGDHHTAQFQVSPELMPLALHADAARAIRESVGLPIILGGSITTPGMAEDLLASGACDLVALGRPLLADPEWPNKAAAGRATDIRPCIRCNEGCIVRGLHMQHGVRCSVNPRSGREWLSVPARSNVGLRRIVVVGSGPSGIEAATALSRQGHHVRLHGRPELGGGLRIAALPSFKHDVSRFLQHLLAQLDSSDVELAGAADASTCADADLVVIATGAAPRPPALPGVDTGNVLSAREALVSRLAGKDVVVIGAGPTGTQTALSLQGDGANVTVVEQAPQILPGEPRMQLDTYGEALSSSGASVLTSTTAKAVTGKGVEVEGPGGASTLPAEVIVHATGRAPRLDLAEALRVRGANVRLIGSARRLGTLHDAVHDAFDLTVQLARR